VRNEWDRETSVLVCPRTGVRNEWDRETSVLVMSLFIFAEVSSVSEDTRRRSNVNGRIKYIIVIFIPLPVDIYHLIVAVWPKFIKGITL